MTSEYVILLTWAFSSLVSSDQLRIDEPQWDHIRCLPKLYQCNRQEANGTTMPLRLCQCDVDCGKFGDCCYDEANKLFEIEEVNNAEMLKDWLKCEALGDGVQAYVVSDCPSNYQDSLLHQRCLRRDIPKKEYTHVFDMPVAHNGLMYANVFCATCHGVVGVSPVQIECPHGIQKDEFKKSATYQPGKRSWRLADGNVCRMKVKHEFPLRKCQDHISKCPPTWNITDTVRACEAYALPVVDVITSYNNQHCALCNGVEISNLTCFFSIWKVFFSPAPSFSIIFDFGIDDSKVGTVKRCRDDHFWDPLHETCIPVACSDCEGHFNKPSCKKITLKSGEYEEIKNGTRIQYLIHQWETILDEDKVHRNGSVIWTCENVLHNTTPGHEGPAAGNLKDGTFCNKIHLKPDEYESIRTGTATVYLIRKWNTTLNDSHVFRDNMSVWTCQHFLLDMTSEDISKFEDIEEYLTTICLSVSVVCLAMHVLIYASLPGLRTPHKTNLNCLCWTLMLAHGLFLLGASETSERAICIAISSFLHFLFLSVLCWMFVISSHICHTFYKLVLQSTVCKPDKNWKCAIYAWGIPGLVAFAAFIVNQVKNDIIISPKFAEGACWFGNRLGLAVWFAIPAAVILMLNIGSYVMTVYCILKHTRAQKDMSKTNKISGSKKVTFYLYLKLAVLMGLTWTFGFLSTLTNWTFMRYPFLVFNGLQGLFIFLAFDVKVKVFRLLHQRLFGRFLKKKTPRTPTIRIEEVTSSGQLESCKSTSTSVLP